VRDAVHVERPRFQDHGLPFPQHHPQATAAVAASSSLTPLPTLNV
jgi:hypothetical protein